jgi:antitoxin component YwqK of YwqJK toxin-antitoxin module
MKLNKILIIFLILLLSCNQTEIFDLHSNGKIKSEKVCSFSLINKCLKKQYFINGNIEYIISFKDGIKHGKEIVYYINGYKKQEYTFKNGMKQGAAYEFYPNGVLKEIENFVNDTLEGEIKEYYINGNIKSIQNYSKGVWEGKIMFYFPNGNLQAEWDCVNGKGISDKRYNSKGELIYYATKDSLFIPKFN